MVPIQSECQEWAGEHDLTEAELEFVFLPSEYEPNFFFSQTIQRDQKEDGKKYLEKMGEGMKATESDGGRELTGLSEATEE